VIELLLEADRALGLGLVDQAERLFRQAADADPRNSIAVVGLARVALERGDDSGALREARRALRIDPENVAAARLAARLEEVMAFRGEAVPEDEGAAEAVVGVEAKAEPMAEAKAEAADAVAPDPARPPAPASVKARAPVPAPRRGIVDRLFRRKRP
jgi:tetratricopeptide (TPR) repeat protein